jgi:hypothetical protein
MRSKGFPFMTSLVRQLLAVLVLGGVFMAGVFYFGRVTTPPAQKVEKVLPDGQFPR